MLGFRRLVVLSLACFALAGIGSACAADYPSRPIRWIGALNAGLADPAVQKRLAALGATPIPFTAADFGAYMTAETEKWGKVVRSAGVKAQ